MNEVRKTLPHQRLGGKDRRSASHSPVRAGSAMNDRSASRKVGAIFKYPEWKARLFALVAVIGSLLFARQAQAVFIQQFQLSGFTSAADGSRPISAKAVFTINAAKDTITLQLTNLTVDPTRPNQLLTGISFSIFNPTVVNDLQLVSATTIERVVYDNGTYQDFGTVNLLSLDTWSINDMAASPSPLLDLPSSGIYNTTFHPDAQYGIIGNPGSDNLYQGMVTPTGQTPYADQTVTLVYSSKNISSLTSISQITFGFGTNFESRLLSVVPEGSAFLPLAGIVALACAVKFARRRRAENGQPAPNLC
jgi:hypothetical protein